MTIHPKTNNTTYNDCKTGKNPKQAIKPSVKIIEAKTAPAIPKGLRQSLFTDSKMVCNL
jgi:hypothetical protein